MQWYAVYTLPRWEKKVADKLKEAGFESYCPLHKVMRQWKDRKKLVELPLIKGYVFVRVDDARKWNVLDIHGILNFVYWNKKPAKVRDKDINDLKAFMEEHREGQIEVLQLKPGESVEVTAGLFMHEKGIVKAIKGNTVVLQIPALGLYFTARLPFEKIRKTSMVPSS